ncbi:MAG: transcription termination/antitermination protein NusG [bacterium]
MSNSRWYVVHTYSGHENKVKTNLEKQIDAYNLHDEIEQILIPTEDRIEIKGTQRKTVQKKIFKGYIFVKMNLTDETWYVVRNIPGVTGFIGDGNRPTPLSESEVNFILKRMGLEAPRLMVHFGPGEGVRVLFGPFADYSGVIKEVNMEREKVVVLLSLFGRDTPVELEFDQIEKV